MSTTTPFTDRAKTINAALRFSGVTVPNFDRMAKADEHISMQMKQLEVALAGSSEEELVTAGAKWAKSKSSSRDSIIQSVVLTPSHNLYPSRNAHIRRGALQELTASAEKKHPEWHTARILESLRPAVVEAIQGMATEATKSLQDLPEQGKQYMDAGKGAEYMASALIDPETSSLEEIEAYRRATQAWERLDTGMPCDGMEHEYRATDMERETLAIAMARGVAKNPDTMDSSTPLELSDVKKANALWFDRDGMAALFMRVSPSQIVYQGLGKLQPLVDPLGEDAEELEARVKAWDQAHKFLFERWMDKIENRKYLTPDGLDWMHRATDYSRGATDRLARAGFSSGAEATRAYLDSVTWSD